MTLLETLLDTRALSPHGFCLTWEPTLIWLHVVSDLAIGIAYFSIPVTLGWLLWHRRDLGFGWIIWLFAAFILACGTTHFMSVWTLWRADYGIEGLVKAATALVSLGTAAALWPLVPRALALPSHAELRRVNVELQRQISQREAADRSLRESEDRYQLLVHAVTDYAIFMLDLDGTVRSWNPGAERVKGWPESEIVGQHFSVFYTDEERAAGAPARALATALAQGRYETEQWRVRRDGSRFFASVIIDLVQDSTGRPVGFAKVTRDITERLEAQRALDDANAALAQAQKMKAIGQLTGGIAHDFNNLLTAILGSIELIQLNGPAHETAPRLLESARQSAERGATLTRDLLAFSRRQALAPQSLDLNRLVEHLAELLGRTLAVGIVVRPVLAADLWPAYADPTHLETAILNLAINARDAMPDGGSLTLETGNRTVTPREAEGDPDAVAGDHVMLAVTDDGCGMAPEVLAQAFEPFFTTKPVGRGTGLGLSQVYGFVRQSGGFIQIRSTPDRGTTVRLFLPRHAAAAGAAELPRTGSTPPTARRDETILLVEDDEEVRKFSALALEHLGYRVRVAADGPGALELLERDPAIRLLFTDIGLPGMNGRALATAALARRPDLRLLFTTGYGADTGLHGALQDHGVELLGKPFTVAALARRIRETLDRG